MQIIFLSGTKCLWLPQYENKFLVWHKKFGPAQNKTRHKALTSLLISRTLIRNFFSKGNVTFRMLFCHGGISASCIPHTFKAISSEFLFATSACKLNKNICIILNYIKDLSRNGQNTPAHSFTIGKVNSVQEACTKCLAVHVLKFETSQTTWKNKTKILKKSKMGPGLNKKNGKTIEKELKNKWKRIEKELKMIENES